MSNFSGIPRPFGILDAKRAREEEARKREQATSARNTSSTTIGSGGRLDVVGGDLTISEGGNASVKDGGRFLVEGGGSMEIVDDGKIGVTGSSIDPLDGRKAIATASIEAREVIHATGVTLRTPGVYFATEFGAGGSVTAENGRNPVMKSGEKVSGPPGTPGRVASSSQIVAGDVAAVFGASRFDPDAIGAGRPKAYTSLVASPSRLDFKLWDAIAGVQASIEVDGEFPKMYLSAKSGVDVSGPFTVDGAPAAQVPAMYAPLGITGWSSQGAFEVAPTNNGFTRVTVSLDFTRAGTTATVTNTAWTILGTAVPAGALKAGAGPRYFVAFCLQGQLYGFINFDTGQCGVRGVVGSVSIANTGVVSMNTVLLL